MHKCGQCCHSYGGKRLVEWHQVFSFNLGRFPDGFRNPSGGGRKGGGLTFGRGMSTLIDMWNQLLVEPYPHNQHKYEHKQGTRFKADIG